MARTSFEYTGTLGRWNDDRGFGFVDLGDGSKPLFVHISAFPDRSVRPIDGDQLRFTIASGEGDKTRAARVRVVGRAAGARPSRRPAERSDRHRVGAKAGQPTRRGGPRRSGPRRGATSSAIALIVFAIGWILAWALWGIPAWVAIVYAAMSVVAFIAYGVDKRRATTGGWRTSEATLLTIGLLGGWPGAIAGQQLFRHKTTKASFRREFWVTVVLNVIVLVVVLAISVGPWGP